MTTIEKVPIVCINFALVCWALWLVKNIRASLSNQWEPDALFYRAIRCSQRSRELGSLFSRAWIVAVCKVSLRALISLLGSGRVVIGQVFGSSPQPRKLAGSVLGKRRTKYSTTSQAARVKRTQAVFEKQSWISRQDSLRCLTKLRKPKSFLTLSFVFAAVCTVMMSFSARNVFFCVCVFRGLGPFIFMGWGWGCSGI